MTSMEQSRTRVQEEPGPTDIQDSQPSHAASSIPEALGHGAESLDAVAGAEFVDDRIRLQE